MQQDVDTVFSVEELDSYDGEDVRKELAKPPRPANAVTTESIFQDVVSLAKHGDLDSGLEAQHQRNANNPYVMQRNISKLKRSYYLESFMEDLYNINDFGEEFEEQFKKTVEYPRRYTVRESVFHWFEKNSDTFDYKHYLLHVNSKKSNDIILSFLPINWRSRVRDAVSQLAAQSHEKRLNLWHLLRSQFGRGLLRERIETNLRNRATFTMIPRGLSLSGESGAAGGSRVNYAIGKPARRGYRRPTMKITARNTVTKFAYRAIKRNVFEKLRFVRDKEFSDAISTTPPIDLVTNAIDQEAVDHLTSIYSDRIPDFI